MHSLRWLPINICHPWCASLMTSPVHSLILSFHDLCGHSLQRLPSTAPGCMIFSIVSWWQTWLNYDSLWHLTRQLTAEVTDIRQGYWPVAIIFLCFMLSVDFRWVQLLTPKLFPKSYHVVHTIIVNHLNCWKICLAHVNRFACFSCL